MPQERCSSARLGASSMSAIYLLGVVYSSNGAPERGGQEGKPQVLLSSTASYRNPTEILSPAPLRSKPLSSFQLPLLESVPS